MAEDTTPPRKGVRFDQTINFGHLLTAGTFIVLLIAGYYAMRGDQRAMEVRMDRVEAAIGQLTAITIATARVEERYNAVDKRLDRIEQAVRVPLTVPR